MPRGSQDPGSGSFHILPCTWQHRPHSAVRRPASGAVRIRNKGLGSQGQEPRAGLHSLSRLCFSTVPVGPSVRCAVETARPCLLPSHHRALGATHTGHSRAPQCSQLKRKKKKKSKNRLSSFYPPLSLPPPNAPT